MLKVGVTGGIGSGKSTVCNLFKCLEIPVFNADEAGRRALLEDSNVLEAVQHVFGKGVIVEGKPDRKKIAEIVFNNPEELAKLNSIIHPVVRKSFNEWITEQAAPYIIHEAAILFETGIYKQLDFTILVTACKQIRIKRIMQRDGVGEAAILSRMKNQWSDEKKKELTNFIIINDDIIPLLPQIIDIHNAIISKTK